ncbi:unnamed protein product [Vitrella brassicaformis CCMP3155]|uniref:Helicase C-terminal domain-containing protein n=2 Tax=Vitrella brassicaformis TaxID=1169539 RepID=A0A0G4FKD2_VITBC|nr:unnamed protein product [Vitrella brassicaformis CCMP3155]|eukprot:CEM14177.1 unnamed protein product [Vitrella brassicaformis CCMP3155]
MSRRTPLSDVIENAACHNSSSLSWSVFFVHRQSVMSGSPPSPEPPRPSGPLPRLELSQPSIALHPPYPSRNVHSRADLRQHRQEMRHLQYGTNGLPHSGHHRSPTTNHRHHHHQQQQQHQQRASHPLSPLPVASRSQELQSGRQQGPDLRGAALPSPPLHNPFLPLTLPSPVSQQRQQGAKVSASPAKREENRKTMGKRDRSGLANRDVNEPRVHESLPARDGPANGQEHRQDSAGSNDDGVFGLTYSEYRWDFHRVMEVKALLRKHPWAAMKTIVVFAWRQSDAELLADSLMKTRVYGEVETYHSGRTRAQLAAVMDRFITGKVCVLVATSGVDLVHASHALRVDGAIHLTIPQSIENYVKDTKYTGGQPHDNGADGPRGHSHVFVRPEDLLMMHRDASVPLVDPWAATRLACALMDHLIQPRANARTNTSIHKFIHVSRPDQQPESGQGGGGRVVAVSMPSTDAMAALKAQTPDDVTTFFRMLDHTIQHQHQQQQQDGPPTTSTSRIYPNVPLTYKLRFSRATKDDVCEKSDFMRSFMASATQHANGVWSVRATDAVTATGRSPPELSQELAKAANGEGFTVNRCDWQARGVMVVIRGGGEHQEDGREDAFGGMRAAVEATLQKLYETLKVGVAKLEAAFMALYLSTKETGAQAQQDKLNSLVQAYSAHTEGDAGCHHDLVRVVCEAAVGAAKADGLRVESRLDICGGEIGSESFLRFKHLFASAPMNSDQVDQWGISTLNGVRHRTKIANQLSHAVKNTLKNMPLLYELTEQPPTVSTRDVAVKHLAPLTIARALARINTDSLPKAVCEAFKPTTMGAPDIATLPFGFLLDAAQRAVSRHKEQLLTHTRRRAPGLGLPQEQQKRDKKRSMLAANDLPTSQEREGCAPKKVRRTQSNKKNSKKRAAVTELHEGGQRGAKSLKSNFQAGDGNKRPRVTAAVEAVAPENPTDQQMTVAAAAAVPVAAEPTYVTRSKKRKVT